MKTSNITILLLFFISGVANAQFQQDVQGKPIMAIAYTDVVGTPFLFDNLLKGTATMEDGTVYKDIFLKYDSFKDELFFKNPKDETLLTFVLPVKSFLLEAGTETHLYRNGFPEIDNFSKKAYYRVLFDGGITLLVKNYKTMVENKPYNSATTEKRFIHNTNYYVLKEGTMKKFKPSKKDFLELFPAKATEIDAFMRKEKIDFKDNDDLVKVFEYYSSL
ncbi:hypothetical protein [Pedobacter cryophilus]|uniref:Uncharacterized protein n=1 Tax=Pedobacter cryophilus TaxID=2571271 RepID=A0A4U1C6T2_9SPHI|nr:hypothetical protein [Pedobacter cryophilus]TKC01035.1 hypothetical protein FA046_04995 [Pedobacter cryophilus]